MNRETETSSSAVKDRRPLKTRSVRIFQTLAARLATAGVTPNGISIASVVFAMLGACGFLITGWSTDGAVMRGGSGTLWTTEALSRSHLPRMMSSGMSI